MSQSNPSPDENQPPETPARKWTRSPRIEPGTPAFKYLTEQAGIAPGIIEAASKSDGVREGPQATAWFPHRSSDGAITGVSGNGPDFQSMLKGSHKTLFRLPGSETTSRVVLTEQPLEALAVAQIEKLRPDTLYVATGGSLSIGSGEALKAELIRIKDQPNAEFGIATGRGTNGELTARYATKLADEIGTTPIRYTPPDRAFTWHSYLKDNPNADTINPAPGAGAETKPGSEKTIATGAQPSAEAALPKKDPLTELLEQLKTAAANSNQEEMDEIRKRIDRLISEQATPGVAQQASYRMQVAWSLMDVEKLMGRRMNIADDLRTDLANRAITMEGLTNSDIGSLLAATKNIPEQKLVQDIRDLAKFVAAEPDPQMSADIHAKAEQLKNRTIVVLASLNSIASRNKQDTSSTQTSAQSTEKTAQSTQQAAQETQQKAQRTQQTGQETTQKVDQAETKINQSQTAAQVSQSQKTAGAAQDRLEPGQVVAPIRKSGDFMQTLSNIAMTWHEYTHGPNSISGKRAAAKAAEAAAEAAAKGEPPPPAPAPPPPPSFTASRDSSSSGGSSRAVDPSPASQPVKPPQEAGETFADYTNRILFGNQKPAETQTARADAPANWPKTPEDPGISTVMTNVSGDTTQTRIDAATAKASNSATEAANAVKDLLEGSGRDILARINSAARAEGGNVEAVLSEMRPDGKYAGLRQEFDTQIKQNDALGHAVDRAVTLMNVYGEDRAKLDAIYRRFERDPDEIDTKFKAIDETLAKAAQAFPGESPGTAMIENLSEKIREALQRVVATIRQVIGLDPGAVSQPRHDNSPGMSM